MRRPFSNGFACLSLAATLVGCGQKGPVLVPVRGEVTFKGAPLKEGTVVYLPAESGDARQASGRIQPDGTFVLTTFKNGDGVVPGQYNIVIYSYAPRAGAAPTRDQMEAAAKSGKALLETVIPEKYSTPGASGLKDTVDANHTGSKRIELSDKT
jgi:hypothetical protein